MIEGLPLLADLILILSAALLGGLVFSYLKFPPIIGYLLAGALFGPNFLGLLKDSSEISTLASIGVVLLMFTLGVEFSFKKLLESGKVGVFGAILQIITTIVFSISFTFFLDWTLYQSIFFGAALSLSSTAVVVKILESNGMLDSTSGEISLSYLLVQDLALVPLIVFLPALSSDGHLGSIGLAIFKSILILGAVLYLGVNLVPRLIEFIIKRGKELLLPTLIILILASAYFTEKLGLGLALGAFLSGLLVSETEISKEALSQTKPLREFLILLFFVSVGALFNPNILTGGLLGLSLALLVLYLSKFISVFGWVTLFGFHPRISFMSAGNLLQVGEFSFVLVSVGLAGGFILQSQYDLLLSVAAVTLVLTPIISSSSEKVYLRLKRILPAFISSLEGLSQLAEETQVSSQITSHVVVCGCGRVGKYVSSALKHVNIPQIVIDFNPTNLKACENKGVPVIFGDASEEEILKAAMIEEAKALIITYPDQLSASIAIEKAKRLNPNIKILARAHRDIDVEELRSLEIHKVVQPEFEASLTFAHKVLDLMGVDKAEINSFLQHIRRQAPRSV